MSEIQEPKLCPYAPVGQYRKFNASAKPDGYIEAYEKLGTGFGPCLQDKCSMWRVEDVWNPAKSTITKNDDGSSTYDNVYDHNEYCGLAGKP